MAGADFVAGWISGALGLAVGHPMDTVKVRLQARAGYRGALDCVLRTYREETVLGFFKGMSFPLLSVALVNAVMFGTYGTALRCLGGPPRPDRGAPAPPARRVLAAGCCAGLAQSQTHGLGRGGAGGGDTRPPVPGPHALRCLHRARGGAPGAAAGRGGPGAARHPHQRPLLPPLRQPVPRPDAPWAGARCVHGAAGGRRGRVAVLGLRHPHGRGEGAAAGGGQPLPRDPALRPPQRPAGGCPGLPAGPGAELRPGLPRQRRHLLRLREHPPNHHLSPPGCPLAPCSTVLGAPTLPAPA